MSVSSETQAGRVERSDRKPAPGAAIAAVAMAVPDRRIGNDQIARQVGVEEEWIAKRTGTRERPWAEADEG